MKNKVQLRNSTLEYLISSQTLSPSEALDSLLMTEECSVVYFTTFSIIIIFADYCGIPGIYSARASTSSILKMRHYTEHNSEYFIVAIIIDHMSTRDVLATNLYQGGAHYSLIMTVVK